MAGEGCQGVCVCVRACACVRASVIWVSVVWTDVTVLSWTVSSGWRSWLRHHATSRKVTGSIPHYIVGFFNCPNPSSRTMALGSTQPPTEMSTRNLREGKGQPARGTDNLTAICESVYKIWEPRHLTTLWAFTACYRDSFTFIFFTV
jgi:hypothetical protein